ncbi:MAG: thiamine phosphate synthase [Bacteroidetes bacterium]|nr:MAG: thiamine phosphate synthase [Bacteroidota bacterium]
MKLIVVSSPTPVPNERATINSLFEEGVEVFQIHKPDFSKEEIKNFIQQIPTKYHNRIVLHSDFPKFHSLKELEEYKEKHEYAFLSPIFDSISKNGYKSKFTENKSELISAISGKKIIALGGIDEDKIEICRELGFTGVAVLGAIWKNDNPIEKFKRIKALCQKKDLVF